ncbi:MAG: hypothetical protein J6C26_10755, partial [Clostridia bacterium]|nr:hypothetical protein [Clostridia bacterium]
DGSVTYTRYAPSPLNGIFLPFFSAKQEKTSEHRRLRLLSVDGSVTYTWYAPSPLNGIFLPILTF